MNENTHPPTEVYLINISGRDRPGLVAAVTGILAQHALNILDIGQAVIHETLALGLLVEVPQPDQWARVMKELLFIAHNLDIQIRFTQVTLEVYERWVREQGKQRRVITLMGRKLTAAQIAAVAETCAAYGLNIDVITRLSGRISLLQPIALPRACVELSISGRLDDEGSIRRDLLEIARTMPVDIAFHLDDIYRRNRRLVVFDMDSTLIQIEVIDELAQRMGVGTEVAAITAAAMRGEIDFAQSLTQRVALLAGMPEQTLAEVAADLPLTEGAERVTQTLKQLGYKIGIISGGFDYFGRRLQQQLGIDYLFANQLEISEGRLTGRVAGTIIDAQGKADRLRHIAAQEGLSLAQTIAVGDGANDIPMLAVAGMGVAFHAKPLVREQAGRAITNLGLDGLLFLIGIREREITVNALSPTV
jgi:phosphoserine phosphatase